MDKAKLRMISNTIVNVVLCAFLAVCIFAVGVTVLSKKDADGAAEVFGYQMRVVASSSMEKSEYTDVSAYEIKDIPIRSMIFVKVVPKDPAAANEFYRSLKVGDVLTFRYVYTTQVTITHRITSITEKEEGGYIIQLTGDNKNSKEGQMVQTIDTSVPNSTNYVIGKVTGQAYWLGFIMSFLMQPTGIILVIIVPCALIILLEVLKMVKVFGADKKKREQEEKTQTANELEELRRKLAELEQQKAAQVTQQPTENTNAEENKEE